MPLLPDSLPGSLDALLARPLGLLGRRLVALGRRLQQPPDDLPQLPERVRLVHQLRSCSVRPDHQVARLGQLGLQLGPQDGFSLRTQPPGRVKVEAEVDLEEVEEIHDCVS